VNRAYIFLENSTFIMHFAIMLGNKWMKIVLEALCAHKAGTSFICCPYSIEMTTYLIPFFAEKLKGRF
jgi:hypothetical protein